LRTAQQRNIQVLSAMMSDRQRARQGIHSPLTVQPRQFELFGVWADVGEDVDFTLDNLHMAATVDLDASEPIMLRFCFFGPDKAEANFHRVYQPGRTAISIHMQDFYEPNGRVVGQPVTSYLFGGQGVGKVKVSLVVVSDDGRVIHQTSAA
jgi:hypothetical protein